VVATLIFLLLFYLKNGNEDRKTALLNLLFVKELLGIFSMWRKIRKTLRNFCQAAEARDSSILSWVSSILIKDVGVAAAAALQPQRRKQVENRERRLTLE
jgi:hypothetical protein